LEVHVKGYARLTARADATFRVTGTYTQEDRTPIDLTGCSIQWRIKAAITSFSFVDDDNASITDAEAGEFELMLSDELTREIRAEGNAVQKFDLRVLHPDGTKTVLAFGDIVIDDGVDW
jgi:hypothetical protein